MSNMSQTLTLILASGRADHLSPIVAGKPKALVPYGGVFCIADFTLSNCVNSDIERAYLLTQYKSNAMKQYVESSLWRTDIMCLPPRSASGYRGTADSLYQNLDLLRNKDTQYVLVLPADHVYKMNYSRLVRFHASHGGDATIAAVPYLRHRADESMGVYVFNAAALHKALLRDAGNFGSNHDLEGDVLPNLIRSNQVFTYDFSAFDSALGSYWRGVNTIDAYYRAHMEILAMNSPFDPYQDARWPIYAGGRPAASCVMSDPERQAPDSVISEDSDLSGARVLQSVISPSVTVGHAAHIERSVIMRGARVGPGAHIRRAIICEGVEIPAGERIGFDGAKDRNRFFVSDNGVVVVHSINAGRSHRQPIPAVVAKIA